MKNFTVVGLYLDNKQVWVGHIKAENVQAAVDGAKAKVKKDNKDFGNEIAVLSVFKGEHKDVYGGDELYEE